MFIILAIFAFNCLTAITSLTPARYEIAVGSPAKQTITAPRMVENPTQTEALRNAARNNVAPVYAIDMTLADTLISNAQSFFSALSSLRSAAADIRRASAPVSDGAVPAPEDTRSWREVLSENELLALTLKLPVSISDTTLGYALLEAADEDLSLLEELVMSKLQVQLRAGVTAAERDATLAEINKELQITTLPVRLKSLGEMLYDAYLLPTNVEDTVATTRAREEAAAAVETVYYARGAVIVEEGATVTQEQMELLTSLDLVKGANTNRLFDFGVVGYLFCVYALFLAYMRLFEPEVFASGKQMLILLLLFVISLALQWLCYLLDPRIMPAIFAVLLSAILISRSVAAAVNVTTALSFALLAGGSGAGVLSSDSLLALAAMLAVGQVTILFANRSEKRGTLIGAGAVGGLAGAWVVVMGSVMLGASWNSIVVFAGLTLATSLILSVFCVGMLSMWENLFDIVTPARLHELANANHPLLKKMMTAAPGTYHHSMMTASLAEGAAEAIGANALLARTGAMYHDVGKLRRPSYFKENQTDRNIHDSLPALESAGYIIGHVRDAEALLTKYRMPSAVRRIAAEHHGTTLAAYFYYKAKREAEEGEPVPERSFRYPGGTPSTKESAIVMLADSCEAAVRSLANPTREDIADMVDKVIQGKIDDGQLVGCPLTFGELARVEKSFLVTFNGLLHERIRYPDAGEA
ncbi:MAG: HDIG domain-containing protein [Clostridia bacterium]|nr:HDIG domain-containing protein [Clostridia bacterium]